VAEQSIWKKEISFRRAAKPPVRASEPGNAAPAQPGASPAPTGTEPKTSFWKKEISFRRKPVPAAAPVEPVAIDPPAEPFAAFELVQAYAAAPGHAPPPFPVLPSRPEPEPAPEPGAPPEPEPAAPVELFAVAEADSPADENPDPLPAAPAVVAETAPAAPASPAQLGPSPVAPSTGAPAPAPVVVHPPVPAADLPPLPNEPSSKRRKNKEKDGDGRVPFYRRELSLRRKRTTTKETADAPAKARKSRPSPAPGATKKSGRGQKGAKRVVGLKIGGSQLSAALVANNGHAEVLQVARSPLEPGIVAGGELRDPDALADALKRFFAKNKLPKRGVRLGIATNRIGVRTLEIAGIDDPKQLANAIKFRAQEALPIPIDEAVLDYQVLSEAKDAEGETARRILLVLAYRDLVDRYVAACRKAGITLVGIDLEAFALLRALAAPLDDGVQAGAARVAVTVGHDRTTFAVSDGRVCEFTRVLDWGGATLNVALARVLDKAPSEVDAIKHELALDRPDVPAELTAEQAQACRDALRAQVQTFARELVSSLQFYQNQPGSLGIGEIVVTGGTAHLSGFAAELERLIGVRVRVGDPLVRVKLGKRFKEPEQLGSLAVAIGLGIED
jgi:type IV pilus assembly protein PilM